jgi:hypothetical protein
VVLAGVAQIIFMSIDDSLKRNNKDTFHLEAVDRVHDNAAAGTGGAHGEVTWPENMLRRS